MSIKPVKFNESTKKYDVRYRYKDSKGNELLYLGRANFWDSSQYYDECIRYIYIKKKILDNYNKDLSLSRILMDCRKRGLHHFVWSIKPRKLVEDIGKENATICW